MGLFSGISRNNSNNNINNNNNNNNHRFFISFMRRHIIIFPICCLPMLLLYEVHNLLSQTKTITGHNLEPTPWHVFPVDEESTYPSASTILRCTYLTCGAPPIDPPPRPTGPAPQCPDFFKSIHRDLGPWAESKISMAHVAEAQNHASFRLVILSGKLYVDFYYACVQSRAMFTIWGFLQLLRKYPGQVPDVDLMFDCMDKPTINRTEHESMPLPLFRYCTTSQHFDIPLPDWSFWGWSEINIMPWDEEFKSIKQGSKRRSWKRKWPIAYWKGNPDVVSPIRYELLQCNGTREWRAQIMRQDWAEETRRGFGESKLSNQCDHRYKIYAEGYAWSVSLKYILSCGCCTLIITPQYEDFFSRGLIPHNNYLPIPVAEMCPAIRFAVEWGNSYPSDAEAIGRAAQDFMESLSMDRVYDYMYHVLSEYAKLQTYTPIRPSTAVEVCEESVLCFAKGNQKEWLQRSTAYPSSTPPCTLPPL